MTSTYIIKDYNNFPEEEIKSISLTTDNHKDDQQYIYLNGKSLYVNGTNIIFVKKISPSKFRFRLDQTNAKTYKHFRGFIRHLTDTLSKKISAKSKDLIGKHLGKKKIKKVIFKPFIDEQGYITVHMHDLVRSVRGGVETDKTLGTSVIENDTPLTGVSTSTFSKKFKRGTVFKPQYLIDYVNVDYKSIQLIVSLIRLELLSPQENSVPKKKKTIYHYSDEDDSDQDYVEEEEVKVKEEPLLKKEEIKEEKKGEESDSYSSESGSESEDEYEEKQQ